MYAVIIINLKSFHPLTSGWSRESGCGSSHQAPPLQSTWLSQYDHRGRGFPFWGCPLCRGFPQGGPWWRWLHHQCQAHCLCSSQWYDQLLTRWHYPWLQPSLLPHALWLHTAGAAQEGRCYWVILLWVKSKLLWNLIELMYSSRLLGDSCRRFC